MTQHTLVEGLNQKETKNDSLPNGWIAYKLGDLVEVKGGKRLPKGSNFSSQPTKYPYIRIANFQNNSVKVDSLKYITEEDHTQIMRYIINKEDIYISIAGTIGVVGTVPEELDGANLTENASRLIIKEKEIIDKSYLVFFLSSQSVQREISIRTTKTSQPKLALMRIKDIPVVVPPLLEQQQIAQKLSRIKKAKEESAIVLDSLKELKKSLIKHLFMYGAVSLEAATRVKLKETEAGEIPEHWAFLPLSEFLKPCSRKVKKPDKCYKRLGIRSHGKGTFLNNNFNPNEISLKELFQVKENDLIVNITFAWEGAIAIVKNVDEGALVSHRFPTYTFNKEKVIPEYFKYTIIQRKFVDNLVLISPGSAGRNRVMKKSEFIKIKTSVPPILEQEKIANVLSTVDLAIESEERNKKGVEAVYNSTLNNLISGKNRVNNLEF
jgi:type I restriction enzyme, S subunit